MRIYRRRHDGERFPWETLPGVKPIAPLEAGKAAKGSWRTLPGGEVVGLVQHRGSMNFSRALHEVIHVLRRIGDEGHHRRSHFCALATPATWRLLPTRCSLPNERAAARLLSNCPDGQFIEVGA